MFRFQIDKGPSVTMIKIEGRLVREFAEDLRRYAMQLNLPPPTVVDLSDVTFVDEVGEDVLSWFKWLGTKFMASTAYSLDVCKRLPMTTKIQEPSPSIHQITACKSS